MQIRLCPKCGKQNGGNAWNCVDCGATLSMNTLVELENTRTSTGKIKICPKCGKQNDMNIWNCADCGATLSVNTLVETENIQTKQLELAYQHTLGNISPYFKNDILNNFFESLQTDEKILRGFDICLPCSSAPFWFGYMVVTSQRLISVYFKADTHFSLLEGNIPQRSFTHSGTRSDGETLIDRLDSPLTAKEKDSRDAIILSLGDLSSIELVQDMVLHTKFRKSDGISLVPYLIKFYFNDEAYEIYNLLKKFLKKSSGEVLYDLA